MKDLKARENISYNKSFSTLADILETKDLPIELGTFDDFVQNIFAKSYPQYNFNTWHIRLLAARVDEAINSDNNFLLAVLPRYHLKSSVIGYAGSIYRMLTAPTNYSEGLYISYKDELAGIHLSHIKNSIKDNPILSPLMKDLNPNSDILVNYRIGNRRCKMLGSGIFAVKRGLHTDSLVTCLIPETKIYTCPNVYKKYGGGYKRIDKIVVGDMVKTHLGNNKKVTKVFTRQVNEELIVLHLNNKEIIKVTKNHPLLTRNGWKKAEELLENDILMKLKFFSSSSKGKSYTERYGAEKGEKLRKNRFRDVDRSKQYKPTKNKTLEEYYGAEQALKNGTRITKIEKEPYKGFVYNLEVEEDHSYVGKGVIYHNCDDLMGDVLNPLVLTEIEKVKKIFDAEILNIPNKNCPLFVFGTIISDTDLFFHLKEKEKFREHTIWLPAIDPDGEHKVLWEEMYNREWLDQRKVDGGWKAFSTEFLLTPLLATNAFITRDEIDQVLDKNLKNYSLHHVIDKKNNYVVAGFDVGKRRNPSHFSVLISDEEDNLHMIHQSFWDGLDYTEQIEKLKLAIENFNIDKLYWDATRGELEDRSLPTRQCVPIKFTARGDHNQNWYATEFAKRVENRTIKLIDDDRFISQIVCVDNNLKAPDTPRGHGDAFWSCALAVGAYQDFYAKDRTKGVSYLGDIKELFEERDISTNIERQKTFDNVCKICGKRGLERLDNGKVKCSICFAEY